MCRYASREPPNRTSTVFEVWTGIFTVLREGEESWSEWERIGKNGFVEWCGEGGSVVALFSLFAAMGMLMNPDELPMKHQCHEISNFDLFSVVKLEFIITVVYRFGGKYHHHVVCMILRSAFTVPAFPVQTSTLIFKSLFR